MKKLQMAFYGFFLVFNGAFLIYNLVTGFDWSKALLPFLIFLVCTFLLRSIIKEDQQSK